jgi:hypothetical protein
VHLYTWSQLFCEDGFDVAGYVSGGVGLKVYGIEDRGMVDRWEEYHLPSEYLLIIVIRLAKV